jgi:hypothetical protein
MGMLIDFAVIKVTAIAGCGEDCGCIDSCSLQATNKKNIHPKQEKITHFFCADLKAWKY